MCCTPLPPSAHAVWEWIHSWPPYHQTLLDNLQFIHTWGQAEAFTYATVIHKTLHWSSLHSYVIFYMRPYLKLSSNFWTIFHETNQSLSCFRLELSIFCLWKYCLKKTANTLTIELSTFTCPSWIPSHSVLDWLWQNTSIRNQEHEGPECLSALTLFVS